MPRYKPYDYNQLLMVPVSLDEQLMPGTLEYAIHQLIEERIDTSIFDEKYRNDETGPTRVRPEGAAEDRAVCLLARDAAFPADRAGLQGEHHVHGAGLRPEAGPQHDRRVCFLDGRRAGCRVCSPRCCWSARKRGCWAGRISVWTD